MYAAMTGHFPVTTQRQIALRMFIWIAALMVGAVWAGQIVLRMLGLTLGALTLTGGLLLSLWSIPMMRGTNSDERVAGTVELEYARWRSFIAVPLIFPLSIGSAVISFVIATAAHFQTKADLCVISLLCVLHASMISITYVFSGLCCKRLGDVAMPLVERLSGIVLTAIAFQMLARGIRDLLPGLAQ
ncbi:Membrane protein, MarC family [Caballeronia sordidicola]|uniref:UPF0056 membrane protein n=2 Tax=Caballeronia sordidicola TaxID=196367 RepID=A0A226X8H1_CABSO|nr:Membrane protein, MarC family [Caballeronia sordidicola]